MTPLHALRARISSDRGLALPLALLVLLLVSVVGFSLIAVGMTDVTIATNWRSYNTAFYAADAGIQSGVVSLRSLLQSTPNPTQATLNKTFSLSTAPTLSDTMLTFKTFSVVAGAAPYRTTYATGPFQGLFGVTTDYQITSQVTGPGGTQATLTQTVKSVQVPLFQFGVFYGKGVDLEIAPGPNMTINGRMHSNSNIYMGAGNKLTIDAPVTTTGGIYRRIKREATNPWGKDPDIMGADGKYHALNFDHDYQPGFTSKWNSPSDWASKAQSTFGGTVMDGVMGAKELTPPIPELFQNPSEPDKVSHQLIEMPKGSDSPELKEAKLYSQAGLRIVDGIATDNNGNDVTASVVATGALSTKTFYDQREAKTVTVTQVDIGKLASANLPALTTGNGAGLLYVASTVPPTPATMPGVRLVNGATLPKDGLTVVSQNPIYVQGDYNTTNNFTDPATGSLTHAPAAVIGDAITVLSNNWTPNNSDAKGKDSYTSRTATQTTVNAAFMTGPSAESVLGEGNGQLENDIRFLEKWGGKKFDYNGSLVNLWHSQQATGGWRSPGTYYDPPDRFYAYDPLFNSALPPGTPSAVVITMGQWAQK